jgi:lysophospholipase L1-like esterase
MKKPILWITIITSILLIIFWYLKTSLWLERLLVFGQMPVQGKSWNTEVEKFSSLYPGDAADCFFLGDSHIEQCEWQELFPDIRCANRGIGGETTEGLLLRLHTLPPKGKNRFVFLQTGVNDLLARAKTEIIIGRYRQITVNLKDRGFRPVINLVFPVRYQEDLNHKIPELNNKLATMAKSLQCPVIDITSKISRKTRLSEDFSTDGIHLNHKGYELWISEIKHFLN